MSTDLETLDRITRIEQRLDILDQRLDERSKNLRDTFYELEERIDNLKDQTSRPAQPLTKGP